MTESTTQAATHRKLQKLAVFIELERRLRQCTDKASLAFTLVNETHSLCNYRQAVLWHHQGGMNGNIGAVSGLAVPDPSAPYSSWVRKLCSHLHATNSTGGARAIMTLEIPDKIARDWQHWLPQHAVWVPLTDQTANIESGLILARDEPWLDADLTLLNYLAETYVHAQAALLHSSPFWNRISARKKRIWMVCIGVLGIISVLPISQTTLAPAEIVAHDPVIIRAGIDGVIDTINVTPNQRVESGDSLITLDATRLRNQIEVANRALEIAEAEYRQAAQQGVFDNQANASLTILKGRTEQRIAEVDYLQSLLDRINIQAPQNGIAIFSNADDWEGRPVAVGERIMELADPAMTEIEILLPVSDAITLENGARVRLFLNTLPHAPIEANLRFASYQSQLNPDGSLSYQLLASFKDTEDSARIGLKGTAKLYGDRTLLIMYVLRRPLTALRQLIGM